MMEDHEDDGGHAGPLAHRLRPANPARVSGPPSVVHSPKTPASSHLSRSTTTHIQDSTSESDSESYTDSESDSDAGSEDDFSASTLEAATAAKQSIERFYKNFFHSLRERQERRTSYEMKMKQLDLSDKEKESKRKRLDRIESQYLRARRIKLTKDTFTTIQVIGRGSFGEVQLVQMTGTKKYFAMKKLKKSKMIERNQVEHVTKERDALAQLNDFYKENPWVVRLYYSFQDALYLYLIMEYVPGGDLMSQLIRYDRFPEEVTRFFLAEIVLAVESIHAMNYIHRDLKPDNILLDSKGHIKLSDFGLCASGMTTDERVTSMQAMYQKYADPIHGTSTNSIGSSNGTGGTHGNGSNAGSLNAGSSPLTSGSAYNSQSPNGNGYNNQGSISGYNDPNLTSPTGTWDSDRFASWKKRRRQLAFSEVGTPDYMAPEVLNPDGKGYGKECDWWSVGVIMFEMLAGFPTFYSNSDSGSGSTIRKIFNWRETLDHAFAEAGNNFSPLAKDLILKFLTDAPQRIGTNGGAQEIKAHPFFRGLDWNSVRTIRAPIIPSLSGPSDTSNFNVDHLSDSDSDSDVDSETTDADDEERNRIDQQYPMIRGRRLRQTDIPFIGFTYKNLAAVPQLIRSQPQQR